MKYICRAFDRHGKSRQELVEAASAEEAAEALRRQGLFVGDVKPAKGEVSLPDRAAPTTKSAGRGTPRQLASFMRQLAVLVRTGTPLVDAITSLEKQTTEVRWRRVIEDVRSRVEQGQPLSEALTVHPRTFDSVCRSLVRAGESGGSLADMLTRLAELTGAQLRIRRQIKGAMVYPAVLICVSIGVVTTMLLFVMPRFAGLFKSLEVPLPPTTKALMSLSNFLVAYWWAVLIGLAAIVGGTIAWVRTPDGKSYLHALLIRLPQVGRMVRGLNTGRFARLMGMLLESKVPMLECIELTQQATTNIHYRALLGRAHESLQRGEPLSAAVCEGGLIEPSVCEALKSGERTGQIGPVLSSMADFIEEQNETVIKTITGLIEPLILITLGAVVGLMATSMFLPLFDLTAAAGSGGGGAP